MKDETEKVDKIDDREVTNDELTKDEQKEEQNTNMDGEETHRYEEYESLKKSVENVEKKLDSISALFVRNVSSEHQIPKQEEPKEDEYPPKELDLSL